MSTAPLNASNYTVNRDANPSASTYILFSSFSFSMFFFVWFLVPETKGMSLEHMDALFGVTDLNPKASSLSEKDTAEVHLDTPRKQNV